MVHCLLGKEKEFKHNDGQGLKTKYYNTHWRNKKYDKKKSRSP